MLRASRWACVLALAAAGCGGAPPEVTGSVEEFELRSAAVGDDYRILVRLPPSYGAGQERRYPVVYQLDATVMGSEFDKMSARASQLEQEGTVPESIVVGVGWPYDGMAPGKKGRWRDFCLTYRDGSPAGAEAFLQFLREELIPAIDARYPTDPARGRTLSGHSLGGYFALLMLLRTGAEASPPFQRFIVGDPSLGNDDWNLLDEDEALSAKTTALPRTLYLLIARYDGAIQRLGFDEVAGRLARYSGLEMGTAVEATDHGGALELAFSQGLAFVLGGAR